METILNVRLEFMDISISHFSQYFAISSKLGFIFLLKNTIAKQMLY